MAPITLFIAILSRSFFLAAVLAAILIWIPAPVSFAGDGAEVAAKTAEGFRFTSRDARRTSRDTGFYVRATERGFKPGTSVLDSDVISFLYELAAENRFERRSVKAYAAPATATFSGPYFRNVKNQILSGDNLNSYDQFVLSFTETFGALNNVVDRLLGIGPKEKIHWNFILAQGSGHDSKLDNIVRQSPLKSGSSPIYGLRFSVNW